MYEQSGCFDPNTIAQIAVAVTDATPPPLMVAPNHTNNFEENLFYQHPNQPCPEDVSALTAMEITHQNHLGLNMGNDNSINNMVNNNIMDTHFVQEVIDVVPYDYDQSTWGVEELQEMDFGVSYQQHDQQQPNDQQFQQIEAQNCSQSYNSSSILDPSYPSPDLLNLLHLPKCSTFQNSMAFFGDFPIGTESTTASSVLYDPLLHLNLPPQPPALRELFQSLPRGYSLPTSRNGSSLFGGSGDDIDANGVVYQDGDNEVLEFNRGIACVAKGREGKGTKHFATEKQRREQLNGKYKILRSLIPKPTKIDRASVVGDAIDYIRELLRTVSELKLLVEKKRYGKEMSKRRKTEDDAAESCNMKPFGDFDGCIRTSWLQRKSKDTEVDVRIIDDEVTIKLVHRKNINSLLFVSKVLDEVQLDLHHVAGGQVGEYCSFLFNSKIYEGSSLYASAVANKVIEVMERQYAAALPPKGSY